jgi:hypothetical protein
MVYFVALPFTRIEEGGSAPGEVVECPNEGAAVRRMAAACASAR